LDPDLQPRVPYMVMRKPNILPSTEDLTTRKLLLPCKITFALQVRPNHNTITRINHRHQHILRIISTPQGNPS
jgi:hypothetical protein